MRILIIEDELKTSKFLEEGLNAHGFQVSLAHDGQEGIFIAQEFAFDLVILDVMLPKLDGWQVISVLKTIQPTLRILFLSAKDSLPDKIKGFDLGADDYLIKPFSFSELLARVKALLKRQHLSLTNIICIADLEIDLVKHKVSRSNQNIELTPKEYALLLFLAEHPGEMLSRTLIAEAVWGIHFQTETNVVDVAIRRLRQKVDDPFHPKLIHAKRGVGYVFEVR